MLHYWAIRQCDLRDLQARLASPTASGLTETDVIPSRTRCLSNHQLEFPGREARGNGSPPRGGGTALQSPSR